MESFTRDEIVNFLLSAGSEKLKFRIEFPENISSREWFDWAIELFFGNAADSTFDVQTLSAIRTTREMEALGIFCALSFWEREPLGIEMSDSTLVYMSGRMSPVIENLSQGHFINYITQIGKNCFWVAKLSLKTSKLFGWTTILHG